MKAGEVPWTILRATQFHEFATQLFATLRQGPVVPIPVMATQPVAAREVAEMLVEIVEASPRPARRSSSRGPPRSASSARFAATAVRPK